MGPVRQNPIQRTASLFICVCIALCKIVAHNIAQNRPDSFPPYPPDNHHISDDVYLREMQDPKNCQKGAIWAPSQTLSGYIFATKARIDNRKKLLSSAMYSTSSGRQPNFAALNIRRHLCSAGRPSRWALAHISSLF